MSSEITFFVPGHPKPAGSKRAFIPRGWKRAIITDASGKAGKDWRGDIKRNCVDSYHGEPMTGPVKVKFVFQLQRPNSHFGTGKNSAILKESAPTWPVVKPDALKLARAAEDAMTGLIYRDDCQIVEEIILKIYGIPGMWVTIQPMA